MNKHLIAARDHSNKHRAMTKDMLTHLLASHQLQDTTISIYFFHHF
jgi:hypothetical protein